jgi:AraC-like DNA-binding protein
MPGKDNLFAEKRYTDIVGSDIGLVSVGHREGALNHIYTGSSHYQHILAYVEEGEAVLFVNRRPHRLRPGMLYVLFRDAHNYYDASHTLWTIHWIGLDGSDVMRLFRILGLSPDRPTMELSNAEEICARLKQMFTLTKEEGYSAKFSLKAELYRMLSLLLRNRELSGAVTRNYVSETNDLLERHFRDPIKVEEIADTLHVDRCHLSRIYRRETGITIKEKLREIQFKEAGKLLADGYSVKDTALSCGFRDPLYFSKVYSKRYGVPPSSAKSI